AQKYGSKWPMTVGLALAGTGLGVQTFISATTPFALLIPVFMIMGIGMGCTMAPMTAAVMNAVGPARAGLGSAATNTSREVGGVFGIAFLGTLLTTKLRGSLISALASAPLTAAQKSAIVATAGHGRIDPGMLQQLPPVQAEFIRAAFVNSFMDGFHVTVLVAAGILILAAIIANIWIPSGAPRSEMLDLHEAHSREL
ncbi:MAG: hypothetical protein ACRD1T_12840, partial [Acidimicrobiia bacterium]